ncbi:MAG: metallophosphoesterase [Oscillospiraceae bacterium]|nr:metallophosphoesterase [Oscillospiraceae bacterium]
MKRDVLTIDTSRPLRLLQLTDLHLGLHFDQKYRRLTEKLVRDAIEGTSPDLIALTGDLAWCPETERIYRDFCALMDGYGIPWGFCFGNHDRDYVKDVRCLEDILEASETCLYTNGCEEAFGYGNYCVRLEDGNGKLIHALYFFDNAWVHHYDGMHHLTCGSLSHNRFFRANQHELKRNGDRFCVWGFVHVPLMEYADMWRQGGCVGLRNGPEAHALVNTGLFCTMAEDKLTKGIFCGHDHGTCYSGEYYGIRLIYGRTTGFNQSKGGVTVTPCGARVCDITPQGEVSTFFFLEDGTLRNADDTPKVDL